MSPELISASGVIVSAGLSALISWKVAKYNAEQKYKELHETFLHEDQARQDAHRLELEKLHEQWKHDLSSQDAQRSAKKDDALYSAVSLAMEEVSRYLVHDYNMHALSEATAAVSSAAVYADGELKSLLDQMGTALIAKNTERVTELKSLVLQSLSA